YSKNSTDLSEWVNALNGYKYDSFNSDVLLNAYVKDGNVMFSDKVAYRFLLFPGSTKMSPNNMMSLAVVQKMLALVKEGATVFVNEKPNSMPGKHSDKDKQAWQKVIDALWSGQGKTQWDLGKGKVVQLPYLGHDFSEFGLQPDLSVDAKGQIAWTHRKTAQSDIYFLSNQKAENQLYSFLFRVKGKVPYLYNPVTDKETEIKEWYNGKKGTRIPLRFYKNESLFIVFKESTTLNQQHNGKNWSEYQTVQTLNEDWMLQFDSKFNGPSKPIQINKLFDWTTSANDSIKYYSGTVTYTKIFNWDKNTESDFWLQLEEVNNIAEISLNGKDCGVIWTHPYRVNISEAIKKGENSLKIKVTNTWANRLIGDQQLPEDKRLTWTTAPFRLTDEPLLKAGLLGAINIIKENNK
ncbi:MAG TPA: glycosyl hydrolase, partial [Mariniflexile sp.]